MGAAALAADVELPVKTPPPPPPAPLSWVSGFVELDGESFLINPQGQALIDHGAGTLLADLNLALYKDKAGFINDLTLSGFVSLDFASNLPGFFGVIATPGGSANGVLFDTVLGSAQTLTFGQYWTLQNIYFFVTSDDVQTTGPSPKGFIYSGFPGVQADEVKLSLNDSFTGWPITFNPYVTLWYQPNGVSSLGGSAGCFACTVNAYDFLVGMTPTVRLQKYLGIPVTLKAPTYVTVGPSSFWNGFASIGFPSSGSIGTFTTGVTAVMPLSWMPAIWPLVRQSGFPVVRCHQHRPAGQQCTDRLCHTQRCRMWQRQNQQHLSRVWRHRRDVLIA